MKIKSSILFFKIFLIIFTIFQHKINSELCKDPSQYFQFVEGFETKVHKVTTPDGYNLTLFQSLPSHYSFNNLDPTSKKGNFPYIQIINEKIFLKTI